MEIYHVVLPLFFHISMLISISSIPKASTNNTLIQMVILRRFIDVINESVLACQGINILGTYLIAAAWYSFLGEICFKPTSVANDPE